MTSAIESQPLLPAAHPPQNVPLGRHFSWLPRIDDTYYVRTSRSEAQRFLTSKTGHYSVLLLVSLDISCIFADFLINLYLCERECGGPKEGQYEGLHQTQEALNIISLVFSCLFMLELLASIWAFGLP